MPHNKIKHRIRWFQQTLKAMNVIERISSGRSLWRHCRKTSQGFPKSGRGLFSGIQYRSRRSDFRKFNNGVTGQYRAGSSLPDFTTLSAQKAAGLCCSLQNDCDYIDFIVEAIRPIAHQLVDGGSVVLNIGQDILIRGGLLVPSILSACYWPCAKSLTST